MAHQRRSAAKKTPAKKEPAKKATARRPQRSQGKRDAGSASQVPSTRRGSRTRIGQAGRRPRQGSASDTRPPVPIDGRSVDAGSGPTRRCVAASGSRCWDWQARTGSPPATPRWYPAPGRELPGRTRRRRRPRGAGHRTGGRRDGSSAVRRPYVNPVLSRALAPASGPRERESAERGCAPGRDLTEPLAARGRRLRADSEYEADAAVAAILARDDPVGHGAAGPHRAGHHSRRHRQRCCDATADQVDLTGFAIDNIDLARVIEASLDEVDFTGLAISRLDFARAVTAALEQVDVLIGRPRSARPRQGHRVPARERRRHRDDQDRTRGRGR